MSFDTIKFLNDFDIQYSTSGKKVTKGDVQLQICPFCHADGYYFGMGVVKERYHCWLCDKGGKNITFIVAKLLNTSYNKAKEITSNYGGIETFEATEERSPASEVKIAGMTALQPIHTNYLIKRGYDPKLLEMKYRIGGCHIIGRFPYRIVIPVFENDQMITATSRDVTDQQTERYLSLSIEESVVNIKESVYNIDSCIKENILIVEGPFDVWRIGGCTVSMFGTALNHCQVCRILAKGPKRVYILFDNEEQAQINANKLAACFAPLVPHVEIIEIAEKDPGELTPGKALEIKNELGV
jgi:DNA primase